MKKLDLKTKIGYGMAGVGDSALYALVGNFAIYFLTIIAGIPPATAGTIAAIGALWETICGAVIGNISDKTVTRFGKRKPYIMGAAFPLAVFTSLFFHTIDAGNGFKTVYYGVMLVLFWTTFTIFFVPYLAWGAELTHDYHERTVLRGYVFLFNSMGMATGMVLPMIIVELFFRQGISTETGWQVVGIFCGALSAITIFTGAFIIKDGCSQSDTADRKADQQIKIKEKLLLAFKNIRDLVRSYIEIIKLRCVRYILIASIAYLTAHAAFCADRMYFFKYNMRLSAGEITTVMFLLTFASVVFLPVVLTLNKYIDKKYIFIGGMGVCVFVITVLGVTGIRSFTVLCVYSMAYCVGGISYWQLVPSMLYDACEADQLINEKQRAGTVISLQSLAESFANATGLQIFGIALGISGFNGAAYEQSETALNAVRIIFTYAPAVMMVIAIIFIIRYPITERMYDDITVALRKREAGEKIDMSRYERLR